MDIDPDNCGANYKRIAAGMIRKMIAHAHKYYDIIFSPNQSGLDSSLQPVQCTPTAIDGHASSSITLEFLRDPD